MLLSALILGTAAAVAGAADGRPFEALAWQKRLLVVFAQGDAERERAQRDALPADGLRERDLVLMEVPRSGAVAVPGVGEVPAARVRAAYGVAEDAPFTVLLVGKDGGVKRRSAEPIAARDLFDTVDAMPMRRREMRNGPAS